MNLTKEDQDCLIDYSRKPDNLPIALAIWAIQEDLRIKIITEFLEELRDYIKADLRKKKLPWCVTAHLNPPQWKKKEGILMLAITHKRSNRKIVLYRWTKWQAYLGGKWNDEPALTQEKLEPALEGVGTGGKYDDECFKWWRDIENNYRYLGSDESLTKMNVENGRKEFVEHYGDVLLKAVKAIEDLLTKEGPK